MALFEQPSRTFPARYEGFCHYGDHIEVGEEIAYTADSQIAHAECIEREDDRTTGDKMPAVCSKCFIAHAGECF